ncbi:MAG: two-component system, sensor histidine kinase and response regulator [Pseudomonadota bacterium]|nr:two-component system, sensor histidine kinase and response regulator [Pseudomonadota bacterium]
MSRTMQAGKRLTGGILNKVRPAGFSWPLFLTYAAAAVGGLVLVVGFVRFNALHQEFLSANFDSVHGARTLLKSRFLIDQAARDIEIAISTPERRAQLLQSADKRLLNAEHYSAEGKDGDPTAREKLVERIRSARHELLPLAASENSPALATTLQTASIELQRLARDVDAAELDRWGTLSGLNQELAVRMRTLNQLIAIAFVLFIGVMLILGWALLRTRRAEAELQAAKAESEAIQQTTLDASPIGIAYIDASDPMNRRVLAVNRQMAVIFGYEPEMMPGVSVRRLYAGQDTYARFSTTAPPALARGEVVREEVVMQRRNGMPFWCSLSIKAIDPAEITRGVVWTCEDISERKAVETALLQERVRAEAASQAKSEFLANMSHELRTPFTGLFGLLDLLRQSSLDDSQRRHLELARNSASQMQAIVNDILDFSKIEAGKLIIENVPFNLRALISAIADVHATEAERKGLKFSLDVVEPLTEGLVGDVVRIRQIVDNLLSNAIKFTEYGEIRLAVQAHPESGATAGLRITVEDTGIGIPADMQPHIFDKFTQADSSTTRIYGGSGLGLAICRQLSTLMNGHIDVSSSEGRGSRFSLVLRLPVANAADIPAAAANERSDGRLEDIVVLLAEDNAVNRNMMAETLELMGAIVWTADNGEEAVRLAAEHSPDIILMDCQMPVVDGFEATRRIRAAELPGQHTPIVAITAFATSNVREQCLAEGMMDRFLPKPLNIGDLKTAIRSLVPTARTAPARLSGRVLLVDDNAPILEATQALIVRTGCEVVPARNGNEALDQLEAATRDSGRDFDLVLMDCNMPLLDGWETTRRWRQRERELALPPLAIIAVTADDSQKVRDRCREAGMDGTLPKPFSETQLHALLGDWLR